MKHLAAFALLCLLVTPAWGATYLRLPGVPGESTEIHHPGEMEVLTWSWGAAAVGAAFRGGAGASRAGMQDLKVRKRIDKATPLLFLAAATGQRFPTAVLAMRALSEREGSDFFQLTLTNVVVTGVAEVGVEGAAAADPVEEVSLSAGQWMVRYTGQGPAGAPGDPVCACFNVARNLQCGGCTPAPTR